MTGSSNAMQFLACVMVTSMEPFLVLFCVLVYIGLLFTSYWYIPLLYIVWYVYDCQTPYRAGRLLPFFRNWFMWRHFAEYFPAKLHKTADLDPSKNYLFSAHPHGILAYGGVINFATNVTNFDGTFPGIKVTLLTSNGQFKLPFFRDFLIASGLGAVNADSIEYKLTKMGPGHSVFIAIGGNAGVMIMDQNNCFLKLKERKGFIRMALKTGSVIVPVFTFNEHRIFDVTYAKEGSLLSHFYKIVHDLLEISMPANVCGRPGFWMFVPKQLPLDTVVGAPLDFNEMKSFKKGQDPPEELVSECHQIYKDALRKLYDNHKAQFGAENIPLIYV